MNLHRPPNLEYFKERSDLLKRLRAFFDSLGFLEVQTPCLSRDCVVDPYINPLSLSISLSNHDDHSEVSRFFLQTSPESAMKRMLAAGAPSIYSIGPVFRADESGDIHNIEFTMLEWYDIGADMATEVELLGRLAAELLGSDGHETISYRQLFQDQLSVDPINASDETLRDLVNQVDPGLAASQRDDWLDVLLSEKIQGKLGMDRPVIVTDYPISQAALARPSDNDAQCAARFELFYRGIELANGYDELLDADELLRRAEINNQKRVEIGQERLPMQGQLYHAMQMGLPACSGVAMGVDRMLMACTNATKIEQVIPFTISNA